MSDTTDNQNAGGHGENHHISPIAIESELKRSYLDYAMSVIVSRALPDVRDGLKPVHRRILYSMHESGYDWNKPYRKSARVVGDVIGKYHPHGDQAVYDALVRLAQDFSMRLPLIDGQGNFGSVDGDPPAAMRYTEVRRARAAHALTEDLEKNTVEFQDNYDASEREPVVLPARFPNLLVNGAGGIAVGMATNVPPHNMGEVIDACLAYIEDPSIGIEALTEIVPGPDFPTGALIIGRTAPRSALARGRGSVLMRAKVHIEELRRDREAIIVTELPYQVNKARMLERMADLVRDKRVEGISELRDESDRDGMRVVIELKRDASAQVVLNQLYRFSELQTSFGVNMLALNGGRPELMNLKEMIAAFVLFINQDKVLAASKNHGMAVVAYVPIARGQVPGAEALERIGKAHGKTAAQVSLRYLVQLGLCAIPRTANPVHLKENLDVFGFKLSDAEMAELKKLNATNMRVVNPPHAPVWDTP